MLISNYEITEKIAEATQAAVYKAYNKADPSRPLVLKVLKTINLSEYKKNQFSQKIEHLKVLNDPLLITPISFGMKDGIGFIVQDYFDGVTLDKLYENNPKVPLNDFFTIACKLTRAVDKIHEEGLFVGIDGE